MGKKHPLDIFRMTAGGFDSASRDRRTLPGKVVASTPRPPNGEADAAPDGGAGTGPRGSAGAASALPGTPARSAPLITAARAAAAARAQERFDAARVRSSAATASTPPRTPARVPSKAAPARAAGRKGAINRILLWSVLGVVGVLVVYTVGASGAGLSLKSSQAVAGSYSIVAATWDGTAEGRAAALASCDTLRKLGFPDVRVMGNPSAEAGKFKTYDLFLGSSGAQGELSMLLTQVQSLKNSKGGAAFKDARVVAAPVASN